MNTAPMLREREAARLLGVAPKTLANWRWLSKGPRYARLGRVIVYRREELEAFLDAGKASSGETEKSTDERMS